MPEVRVAHFEDEEASRESLALYLSCLSNGVVEVVAAAEDIEGAKQIIDDIESQVIEIDIIVSDGEGFIEQVLEHIRQRGLSLPVIGASGFDMQHFGVSDQVAADTGKECRYILDAIMDLSAPKDNT